MEQAMLNGITRVVGAVIFNKKRDSILVGRRAAGKKFPFKWEFIGGKVDLGEELNSAVVRELKEEIGMIVKPVKLIDQVEYDYGQDVGVIQVYFIECQSTDYMTFKNFDRNIYEDVRWIQISNLSQLDWIEGDIEFANKLAVSLTAPAPSLN